jgi:hypothetical protein
MTERELNKTRNSYEGAFAAAAEPFALHESDAACYLRNASV